MVLRKETCLWETKSWNCIFQHWHLEITVYVALLVAVMHLCTISNLQWYRHPPWVKTFYKIVLSLLQMCLNEFLWSVSVAIKHLRQHYAYTQASHSSCIRVFPAPSHMAEVLWCSFQTKWFADFRNMRRETCQVEAGSLKVKWSVLVDGKVNLVTTEVHFASIVAYIIF